MKQHFYSYAKDTEIMYNQFVSYLQSVDVFRLADI